MSTALAPPRGPKGHWIAGNLPEFSRDRLGFLDRCAAEFGDVYPMRFGPIRILVMNHPDLVEEVLVAQNRHFVKHFALRLTRSTLGHGLLTSEGEFWRRQRKLAQPAFHRDRIASYAGVMVDYAERMLGTWADGQARDARADMMRLTLEVVTQCLFGAEVGGDAEEAGAAMETALRWFSERIGRLVRLPAAVPTPANLRLRRAVARLDRILFRIIAERRASGADRGDLLSMLLRACDEDDGTGMSDRQLRDEVMTLFMAGHETTANTMAWAWYLLARHPEAEARLHAELDAVLGGRPPTVDDLPRLRFADWVITEALRVYPTAWLIGREAAETCTVGGYRVPAGTTIYLSQWVIHRDGRFFDDPLAFRPERWADGLMRRLPRYAYFPFGGGPRICIGSGFAQMEAVLLLATIARRFRLTMAPGASVRPWASMTLRPDGGVPVVLRRRGEGEPRPEGARAMSGDG